MLKTGVGQINILPTIPSASLFYLPRITQLKLSHKMMCLTCPVPAVKKIHFATQNLLCSAGTVDVGNVGIATFSTIESGFHKHTEGHAPHL